MTFRTRLLVVIAVAMAAAVGIVTWTISTSTETAFERINEQRRRALIEQFRKDFDARGADVVRRIEGIAATEDSVRMALELRSPAADASAYVNRAEELAREHNLYFLDIISADGTIISSAHWPAHFGYKKDWVSRQADWKGTGAFLVREEMPEGSALALVAVRMASAGEGKLYFAGGQRLDRNFLASLPVAEGMRVTLVDLADQANVPPALKPLIDEVRAASRETTRTVRWSAHEADSETVHATPLQGGDHTLLGVLAIGSSRRDQVALTRFIRWTGISAAAGALLIGLIVGAWATARVTRPVRRLSDSAREVAAGNWTVHANVESKDEIGDLARAFNQMTAQLIEQREKLVQTERVAAWRELARRLAHELKNPLFPLQITVENLQRARERHPEQFDEVFRESTTTLLTELSSLKTIIGRFSDFARMPPPQIQSVDLNAIVRNVLKLFEAQFHAGGRPAIEVKIELDERLGEIEADPEQITRALRNLVLNALDVMANGGALTVKTARINGTARLEVSDTGSGLTPEECRRLFTPYYTTKQHGTGLGLAIVQSVVSDHGGRISVASEPGRGTTFQIDLPVTASRREPG